MKLSSLLDSAHIITDSPARSKREAIEALLGLVYPGCDGCQSKEDVLEAILERETHGPTSFPSGIAIPHGRLENFDDCVIGVCVPKEPIADGTTKLRMVVLILTSKLGSNLYLKTLAAFVKLSKDEVLFDQLANAGSGHALHAILDKEKIEVEKNLTVADIMGNEFLRIEPAMTVKELVDKFYATRAGWAIVIGADDRMLGVVSLFEVVSRGIPNYASLMGNLSFLPKLRPFEDLLKEENRIRVEDIMSKPPAVLAPGMSIIEAAFEMTQHHRGTAPVVQDGKVLGVLSLVDIMTKYLRG